MAATIDAPDARLRAALAGAMLMGIVTHGYVLCRPARRCSLRGGVPRGVKSRRRPRREASGARCVYDDPGGVSTVHVIPGARRRR
jgi:hypothetical protein